MMGQQQYMEGIIAIGEVHMILLTMKKHINVQNVEQKRMVQLGCIVVNVTLHGICHLEYQENVVWLQVLRNALIVEEPRKKMVLWLTVHIQVRQAHHTTIAIHTKYHQVQARTHKRKES